MLATWASSAGGCPTWRSCINPSETSLPRLLLIATVYPDTTGNGLAMRAGMFLEALAPTHRVSLLVIPLHNSRNSTADAHINRYCAEVFVVEPQLKAAAPSPSRPTLLQLLAGHVNACAAAVGNRTFDVIQAQRLYTAPLAAALARHASKNGRPRLHLDLDDRESVTHARIAELRRLNLMKAAAALEAAEASRYAEAEREWLPRFDRVYACSPADADAIASLVAGEVRAVPNAIRPPLLLPERLTTHAFRFLFVGSLNYYPNEDAVRFFCTEVVPILRRQAPAPFQVRIVGTGLSDALTSLSRIPEVRLVGAVEDLAREYGEADAVIVPVRAGGGTRIKVLEAFAYQCPVVSTTIGTEGIEAEAGVDYLRGDTPEEMAAQCLRLMQEPDLGARLATHAASVAEERYSQDCVNRLIAGWA